jgi:hypothetical protein
MTLDEMTDAIHALQRSVAALEHRFGEFERTRPIRQVPKPPQPDREMFQELPPPPPSPLPDDAIMLRCLDAVRAKYPRLVADDPDFFDSFLAASMWLAAAPRSEGPNTKRYLGDLSDRAEDFLRARRAAVREPGRGLLVAAIACCDVAYVLPDSSKGVVAAIGISDYGGRAPAPKWADLAQGLCGLLPPTAPEIPKQENPSQVLIRPSWDNQPAWR